MAVSKHAFSSLGGTGDGGGSASGVRVDSWGALGLLGLVRVEDANDGVLGVGESRMFEVGVGDSRGVRVGLGSAAGPVATACRSDGGRSRRLRPCGASR